MNSVLPVWRWLVCLQGQPQCVSKVSLSSGRQRARHWQQPLHHGFQPWWRGSSSCCVSVHKCSGRVQTRSEIFAVCCSGYMQPRPSNRGEKSTVENTIQVREEKWDFSMCGIKKGKIHPDICYTWSNKGAERPGAFVFVSIS